MEQEDLVWQPHRWIKEILPNGRVQSTCQRCRYTAEHPANQQLTGHCRLTASGGASMLIGLGTAEVYLPGCSSGRLGLETMDQLLNSDSFASGFTDQLAHEVETLKERLAATESSSDFENENYDDIRLALQDQPTDPDRERQRVVYWFEKAVALEEDLVHEQVKVEKLQFELDRLRDGIMKLADRITKQENRP